MNSGIKKFQTTSNDIPFTGLTREYMDKIELANEGRYNELSMKKKGGKDGKRKKNNMIKSNNSNFFDYSSPERNQRFLNTDGTERTPTEHGKTTGLNAHDENMNNQDPPPFSGKNTFPIHCPPSLQASNSKTNNARLHLTGGKTTNKKSKTFNYKE